MRGFGEDSRTNVRRLGIFGERGYTASCWQIYKSSVIVGGGQRLQCSNMPPFSAYPRSARYHEERQSALRRLSKGSLGKPLKVTMCANHSVIWILTAIALVGANPQWRRKCVSARFAAFCCHLCQKFDLFVVATDTGRSPAQNNPRPSIVCAEESYSGVAVSLSLANGYCYTAHVTNLTVEQRLSTTVDTLPLPVGGLRLR